jgi:hypothetical protein
MLILESIHSTLVILTDGHSLLHLVVTGNLYGQKDSLHFAAKKPEVTSHRHRNAQLPRQNGHTVSLILYLLLIDLQFFLC